MTNDTNTLNGALQELGETLATNLNNKGISASASDGLTTLVGKINQIPNECYFFDTLTISDYVLKDDTISSKELDNNSVKITNTNTTTTSTFFLINRGPIIGNWKATFDLKGSYASMTFYCQAKTNKFGGTQRLNLNKQTDVTSDYAHFVWTMEDGDATITLDGTEWKTGTYTEDILYPVFAFYSRANNYINIKNLKIIRI